MAESVANLSLTQLKYAWTEQAYARFSGIGFEEINSQYPSTSKSGNLPILRDGSKLLARGAILPHLKSIRNLDALLTDAQLSVSLGMIALVTEKLGAIASFRQWVDEKVYREVTWPRLATIMPFPLKLYAPYLMRRSVVSMLGVRDMTDDEFLRVTAVESYEALSVQLGTKPFFFGEKPTSLDAYVFGHLAEAFTEGTGLQTLLNDFPSLKSFYERVFDIYFSFREESTAPSDNRYLELINLRARKPNATNTEPPVVVNGYVSGDTEAPGIPPELTTVTAAEWKKRKGKRSSRSNRTSPKKSGATEEEREEEEEGSSKGAKEKAGKEKQGVEARRVADANNIWLMCTVGSLAIYAAIILRNVQISISR